MWNSFVVWLYPNASVAGLIVGLLGFGLTISLVWRSKSAASAAKEAAEETRDAVVRATTAADLSSALATMDEIKEHQRQGTWNILPGKYSVLRRALAWKNVPEHAHSIVPWSVWMGNQTQRKRVVVQQAGPELLHEFTYPE